MAWVKTQGVFTNKPWHKSWLVSKSRSESRCRSARWWLAPRLSSEYHNRTDICFTNTRNYCHRNKIYVLTSLLKQIYLHLAESARTYCTVNTVCHSCYHHREFTSRRTHEQRCGDCGFEMTSQLLPLTLSERTSHRLSNDAIWDLRRDSIESRWFSFVNTTWLGPGPSLKWDSVRVQAKSWVKSQVKTVSEYGPWFHIIAYALEYATKQSLDWVIAVLATVMDGVLIIKQIRVIISVFSTPCLEMAQ